MDGVNDVTCHYTCGHTIFMSRCYRTDGWIDDDFTSFLTVFQSYQDDICMIMKAVCNGTSFTVEKISPPAGIELGTLDQ